MQQGLNAFGCVRLLCQHREVDGADVVDGDVVFEIFVDAYDVEVSHGAFGGGGAGGEVSDILAGYDLGGDHGDRHVGDVGAG